MAKNPWNSKAPASPFPTAKSEKRKNTWEACANREKAIQAGRSHVCLSLTYDGLPRIVEIQVVGTTLKDRPAMRVYQVDGQSNSSTTADWRLFCFDECFDVSLTQRQATGPRSDQNDRDKGFERIDWSC